MIWAWLAGMCLKFSLSAEVETLATSVQNILDRGKAGTMTIQLNHFLFAVAIGLMAHAFIGYAPFPIGDDFAYAPLAERAADPSLYARDDQLRLFANHAKVYDWVYNLGKAGLGVEPTFRIVIWILAIVCSVAIWSILRALNGPIWMLPMVIGLGVVTRLDGMGRGGYGGLIAEFFHHHNVALALVLLAFGAAISRRTVLAGLFLGLAVFAQPMTALHGAFVVGMGALLRNPLEMLKLAVVTILVSLPAALPILSSIMPAPDASVSLDLVQDAYRFRAPHHYDPPWWDIAITTLYLTAAGLGALLMWRSDRALGYCSAGMALGFALLHVITVLIYKLELSDWVGFFILDANRSTPALFALGPALALAGMWRTPVQMGHWLTGALLMTLAVINTHVFSFVFLFLGAAMWVGGRLQHGRLTLTMGLIAVLVVVFPARPFSPSVTADQKKIMAVIRDTTPRDALFVIPPGMMEFRLLAKRSAYVDFKLFSVAQPDQAALTRVRIREVMSMNPEDSNTQGWPAVLAWDAAQHRTVTCDMMVEILTSTGAEYYLRKSGEGIPPPECPTLTRAIEAESLVLYELSG